LAGTRPPGIYRSQPGLGDILGARVLGEFGDDPHRYTDARARKNYAGTSPVTRASGRKKVVLARYARNDRLTAALHQQAFCALNSSPGARAYYDTLRARGTGHHAALRQLGNRLVGILHGCLKTNLKRPGFSGGWVLPRSDRLGLVGERSSGVRTPPEARCRSWSAGVGC
jgi:hypothetical protein